MNVRICRSNRINFCNENEMFLEIHNGQTGQKIRGGDTKLINVLQCSLPVYIAPILCKISMHLRNINEKIGLQICRNVNACTASTQFPQLHGNLDAFSGITVYSIGYPTLYIYSDMILSSKHEPRGIYFKLCYASTNNRNDSSILFHKHVHATI